MSDQPLDADQTPQERSRPRPRGNRTTLIRTGRAAARSWLPTVLFVLLASGASLTRADEPAVPASSDAQRDFTKTYLLGVGEYDSDEFTTITGWRLNKSWYFGHQDGEDSGITLVWQKRQDQMSISHEGIRFTRRF